MLSLVFGSAAFAGPPDHAKKIKGAEMSEKALTNHASGGNVQAMDVANENAAFMGGSTGGDGSGDTSGDGTGGDESCASGQWLFDSQGNFIGICP